MKIKCFLTLVAAFAAIFADWDRANAQVEDRMAPAPLTVENFVDPPDSTKPWCYYWQLKGNTSKELITRDLSNMAELGFGGLLVFDSRRYWDDYASTTHVPVPLEIKYEFMSDGWREMTSWLVREAARLGLRVSFNISDSGGQLRGPWDMKELGPRELIWTAEDFVGAAKYSADLSIPKDKEFYRDVALYAVRLVQDAPSAPGKLGDAWRQVVLPGEDAPRFDRIVRLDDFAKNGALEWDAPEGVWRILRFGSTRIGEPGCVDILNSKSTEDYFEKMPGALLTDVGELGGKTLTHFYNVSWEGVHPNWTDGFDKFFELRRNYSIYDCLPTLCGAIPDGGDASKAPRFVEDYLKTIADAFRINCYETIGRLCHERGVGWHSENGGPWNRNSPLFRESDMLEFWGLNDFPQGEFWLGDIKRSNATYAAMAAHIYGRRDVALEAFTHMNKHWSVYPAVLKPYADANFAAGANLMIWHTYTASPEELGKPGFEYFAGTHINSNVTWQPYVRPFLRYMARCQQMLRQGVAESDICVYASDKNYESWGLGEKWNANSKMTPPVGYRYDLLDTEVLAERLEYGDGFFRLPGGAKYRLLVFDPASDAIPLAAIQKIAKLIESGAPVVLGERKPTRVVGLEGGKEADAEVRRLADVVWNGSAANVRKDGNVQATLDAMKVPPACEGVARFAKRATDDAEIYFVVGEGRRDCVFRTSGKKASIWNPATGEVAAARSSATPDGRTAVSVDLPKNGSAFVVFSNSLDVAPVSPTKERERLFELTAPWRVSFDPKYGGPEERIFERLTYWNENEDPGVKYYSGVATYRTEFEATAEQASRELTLVLGEVRDIADVRVNGRELGVVWTDPYEIALGDVVKPGANVLEIDVANCWRNRLIGDAGLEPEQRFTRTNVVLDKNAEKIPPYRGYIPTDPLEPSGLIGSVAVEATK